MPRYPSRTINQFSYYRLGLSRCMTRSDHRQSQIVAPIVASYPLFVLLFGAVMLRDQPITARSAIGVFIIGGIIALLLAARRDLAGEPATVTPRRKHRHRDWRGICRTDSAYHPNSFVTEFCGLTFRS
jgi:hypothetical protein